MGIFSKSIEAASWAKDKALETSKKIFLDTPVKVGAWTRDSIKSLLYTGTQRNYTGALEDKFLTRPAIQIVARAGAGPVEQAEDRVLAERRNRMKKWAEENEPHANRILLKEDEISARSEKNIIDRYTGEVERELHIQAPDPTVMDRMALRRMTELINTSRPAGNHLTLLSSPHPISTINQKRSQFYSDKGIQDDPNPLNLLRYPPQQRKKIDKTGSVQYTMGGADDSYMKYLKKRKPRFDMSGEERRRALEGPIISDDGKNYSCILSEKDEDYGQRIRSQVSERNKLESKALSVQVHLGDPEYPIGGNPFKLYEKLFSEYKDQLNDTQWNQLSLSMSRKGKTVTLTGFLTKNRPFVPETMHEPALPVNFNDDWWFEKAEQAIDQAAPSWAYRNEANLISYYCQDPTKLSSELHDLKIDDLKEERHRILFKALQEMQTAGSTITPGSLVAHIIGMGKIALVGGGPYVNHIFFQALPGDYSSETAVRTIQQKQTARALYANSHFHSGISVLAYTKLRLQIQQLQDQGFDITLDGSSIQPEEEIGGIRNDTLHVKLNINGQAEDLSLLKGTDLFHLTEKSALMGVSEGEGSEDQSFVNIEELLKKIEMMNSQKRINKKAIPLNN